MRFLVDECTGPGVARWLSSQGHEVYSVYEKAAGSKDVDLLRKAYQENYIVITNDKDFGDLVIRDQKLHKGIILMRLQDERTANKISVLESLLQQYSSHIGNNLLVVTERSVRIMGIKNS